MVAGAFLGLALALSKELPLSSVRSCYDKTNTRNRQLPRLI